MDVAFSESAIEKITTDTDIHSQMFGAKAVPLLSYYSRSYSGSGADAVELGDGFILQFRRDTEEVEDRYGPLEARPRLVVYVSQVEPLTSGSHVIDYTDQSFKLISES
jgi:hypothetical protein